MKMELLIFLSFQVMFVKYITQIKLQNISNKIRTLNKF